MELEITLDQDDWEKYRVYCEQELPKRITHWSDRGDVRIGLSLCLVAVFMVILLNYQDFDWSSALLSFGICAILFAYLVLYSAKVKYAYRPSPHGAFVGTHRFKFGDDTIVSSGNEYRAEHKWSGINRIERGNGLILIFLDTAIAMVFPEHKLSNAEEFYSEVLRLNRLGAERRSS